MGERSKSTEAVAQLASQFPSLVALVISEYTDETNAFIKLHRLIDAAETITRFLCIVTVSDVYAQLGRFPPRAEQQGVSQASPTHLRTLAGHPSRALSMLWQDQVTVHSSQSCLRCGKTSGNPDCDQSG